MQVRVSHIIIILLLLFLGKITIDTSNDSSRDPASEYKDTPTENRTDEKASQELLDKQQARPLKK